MKLETRPIAIDARLNAYRGGGIPTYTRCLAEALSAHAPEQPWLVLQHRRARAPLLPGLGVAEARLWTPPHHRLEGWTLPLELWPARPALLHWPDFIPPRWGRWPTVITIHDLAFRRYPEILDAPARRYYGQIGAAVARADGIIAVSASTQRDIHELLGVPLERISVIHSAGSAAMRPLEVAEGEQRRIGETTLTAGGFALFVSTLEPRKNLPTLLKALRVCLDRQPSAGFQLALAGARGWLDSPIYALVRELRLEQHVCLLGAVDDQHLRWLYNACRIYVNPSLYEGFGLPLLEALQCGAPAIVSDASSLPELAGDAALLLPPLEVDAWAEALSLLWHDHPRRAQLGARALAQAARFSWARTAEQTYALYQRVLG